MFSGAMRTVKFIGTRSVFLYAVLFIVLWNIPWFAVARKHAVGQVLTILTPSINYYEDFVLPHDHFDRYKLDQCVKYHKSIGRLYPSESSEAYQMMGFCYALSGDLANAEKTYGIASEIGRGPVYFWPDYNLGVIAYQKGDYGKAVDLLQKALEKETKINTLLWGNSAVFYFVRSSDPKLMDYDIMGSLNESRMRAYFLLLESLIHLEKYKSLSAVAYLGLKENPKEAGMFYYYAGLSSFYKKDYEAAYETLELATMANPHNSNALVYMGKCLEIIGKKDTARIFMQKAGQIRQAEGNYLEKRLDPSVRFF